MTRRALYLGPELHDDAPATIKNAIAVRRVCALTGRCPACGATLELDGQPAPGTVVHATFHHDDDCPAVAP
jgi:hypothetical protein